MDHSLRFTFVIALFLPTTRSQQRETNCASFYSPSAANLGGQLKTD